MAKKKPEKRIIFLEPSFSQVLACRKKESQPFLEIMIQEGENIYQQELGTLLGILEINDESEDSSYIVNYIISVIKKEFFSKGKRGAIESFESALHKANLALSKLAQHENISWIGKFNALIAVIEKNNLHFSQAGKASLFLLRNNTFSDISEGMSEEGDPNPLKTFTSLSSGKLEENDKLILATPEIYEIFSLEEIKKSAIRFSNEDFAQFLKTALENELEKAIALIIDIHEKEAFQEKKNTGKNNYRELNAFSQKTFIPKTKPKEKKEVFDELEEIVGNKDFSDGTYGHIYIKEDPYEPAKKYLEKKPFSIKEFLEKFWKMLKQSSFWKELPFLAKKWFRQSADKIKSAIPKKTILKNKWLPSFSALKEKMAALGRKQKIYALFFLFLVFVFPFFIIKMENKSKSNRDKKEIASQISPESSVSFESQNPGVSEIKDISVLLSDANIRGIVNLNDSFFAIKKDSIIEIPSQKSWLIPKNFGEVFKFAAMDDLNFIFLINQDKKMLSFSPISQKFQESALGFPENTRIQAMDTFMTYLYILDSGNNQIYRYPRAEGGFGEKANWLKESADLSGYENMFLTDSVYLWKKESLVKFFRGKKENLTLENTNPPISFDFLYADDNFIYILDKNNSKLVQFYMSGKIASQLYSEKIKTAESFAVSNDEKTFYLSSPEEVVSFSVE